MSKPNLLVLSPHPDDEILGCGGTIIKAINKGLNCSVIYLSSGESHQNIREEESKKVSKFIGLKDIFFLRLNGETFNNLENINDLLNIANKVRPSIVFAPHNNDGDQEHIVTYNLARQLIWRYNEKHNETDWIKSLLLFEVHKPIQEANLIEDISDTIDLKMKAMNLYASQLQKTQIDEAIKGLNKYRGSVHNNYEYAECFQIKYWYSLLP
jgi:N-acetylglucosamine malate deacetylase 1